MVSLEGMGFTGHYGPKPQTQNVCPNWSVFEKVFFNLFSFFSPCVEFSGLWHISGCLSADILPLLVNLAVYLAMSFYSPVTFLAWHKPALGKVQGHTSLFPTSLICLKNILGWKYQKSLWWCKAGLKWVLFHFLGHVASGQSLQCCVFELNLNFIEHSQNIFLFSWTKILRAKTECVSQDWQNCPIL